MATTAYHSILMTDTSIPSSLLGAVTDIAQLHKAISHQVMDILEDMMRSRHPFQIKPNV